MSLLAPTLEAYSTERLIGQRRASPHTIASYRDTFRLLLAFAQQKTGRPPSRLRLEDLDAPLIGAFLQNLETRRRNSVRTRNTRLSAVHSLFRFAALRPPRARRAYSTRARDPAQALRPAAGDVHDRCRGRRAARRATPLPLARPARPRAARRRDTDRTAGLGT